MNDSNQTLNKSAQSVQAKLQEKGFSFKVIELSSSTRTAKEAADSLSCELAQIVKSLIFQTKSTHQPILVLASGANRVNESSIEKLIGEKIIKADAEYVRKITGFAIGGIPPVGHVQTITHIFIDEDLLNFEILWAAAGTPFSVFCLQPAELLSLVNGKVVSIK